jgi:hypothetical protein
VGLKADCRLGPIIGFLVGFGHITNPNPLSFIPQVPLYRKWGISRLIFLQQTLGNIGAKFVPNSNFPAGYSGRRGGRTVDGD